MRRIAIIAAIVGVLCAPRQALAYSVLAHEANIDALWDTTIAPMLQARFPEATAAEIVEARAYAYGGCVIQDLGYYPFGSHAFSNLLHYVRTGDFVHALIGDAQDIDEYAFALGALGHYAADNSGHPMGVNRAVPLMYPKLKAEFGSAVTYGQAPKKHVLVESPSTWCRSRPARTRRRRITATSGSRSRNRRSSAPSAPPTASR
ncbi:MAG: hypothetical protein DMF93_20210 [Acidobacteria bacterium]|nr:MAG: hypothetical protein DMF93_20210 [Acidobacteriota bacterium]